ncbi:MAG: Type IV pilus assembly protein PilM [Candidatus Moranbacteria bacterium GW2011_GWF2_37_7]|nr:MAG: Type IV pilus assembly protein PilM [Candidatus Moranbacteria bacterium GW2011_GWF2_37_7]
MELKKDGDRVTLNNYGELKIVDFMNVKTGKVDISRLSDKELIDMIRQLLVATRTNIKNAIFSIPIFSSFVTLIDLPPMSDKELAESIPFEARKYIPVPTNEVQFSWSIIEGFRQQSSSQALANLPASKGTSSEITSRVQVLLVAVPNEIINRYKNIAKSAGLIAEFEVEAFSVVRSLIKKGIEDKGVVIIADIGAKSTDICVVDNGFLRMSHNFETSGSSITKALSESAGLNQEKAEEFKIKKGIKLASSEKLALDSILPLIDMIIFEIQRIDTGYQRRTSGRKVQKIILSGGSANLPGLVDYISNQLGIVVTIADPFSKLSASSILNQTLREIGPTFSVAVGLAERNLI